MLPQRHRLRRRSDVLRVRRLGKAWRHPLAVLLVIQAEPRPPFSEGPKVTTAPPVRFAFTASRHVGSAVARNRGKRLLRDAVRHNLELIEPGWDCLLIVREGTPSAPFIDVQQAVHNLLKRANLLAEPNSG